MSRVMRWPLYIAGALTCLLTAAIHTMMKAACVKEPYVFSVKPVRIIAICAFMFAMAFTTGYLALPRIPVIGTTVAPWTGVFLLLAGIGWNFFSASLFTLHTLYSWSAKAAKRYEETMRQVANCRLYYAEVASICRQNGLNLPLELEVFIIEAEAAAAKAATPQPQPVSSQAVTPGLPPGSIPYQPVTTTSPSPVLVGEPVNLKAAGTPIEIPATKNLIYPIANGHHPPPFRTILLPLILPAAIFLNGCHTPATPTPPDQSVSASTPSPPPPPVVVATPAAPGDELGVYLDHSGSVSEASFSEAVHTLMEQLPDIAGTCGVTTVNFYGFGKSWNLTPIKTINLKTQKPKDWQQFMKSIGAEEEPFREQYERDAQQKFKKAVEAYQAEVQTAVSSISADDLVSQAMQSSSDCTGLNALMRRLHKQSDMEITRAVIISDTAQTCNGTKSFVPLAKKNNMKVVFLVVSLKGHESRADEEYEATEKRIKAVWPWSIVKPTFTKDRLSQDLNTVMVQPAIPGQ